MLGRQFAWLSKRLFKRVYSKTFLQEVKTNPKKIKDIYGGMNFPPLNSKPFLVDSATSYHQFLLLLGILLLTFLYRSFLLPKLNPSFFRKFDLRLLLMGEPSPESSPTAPIRALVALSSPIRQIQNPDESAECNDSEILPRGAGYSSVYGDLLCNRRPSRWNFDFSSDDDDDDDDLTVDIFSWSSPENKPPTGVVCCSLFWSKKKKLNNLFFSNNFILNLLFFLFLFLSGCWIE